MYKCKFNFKYFKSKIIINLYSFIFKITVLKRGEKPFIINQLFNFISVEELTQYFQQYSNLLHDELQINLSVSNSGEDQCEVISNLGLSNQNLKKINLNFLHCPIKDGGINLLCQKLQFIQNTQILILNFSLTLISEEGAIQIATMLRNLINLIDLKINLYGNNLGAQGYREIINSVSTIQRIEKLTLGFRKTGLDTSSIINTGVYLNNLINLRYLKLNYKDSQLTDGISQIMNESIRLNLEVSKISDQDIQVLTASLSQNSRLKYLSLNLKNNKISEGIISNLVKQIACNKSLFYFKFKTLYMQLQQSEIGLIKNLITNQMKNLKVLIDDLSQGLNVSSQERKKWLQVKQKMKNLVLYQKNNIFLGFKQ